MANLFSLNRIISPTSNKKKTATPSWSNPYANLSRNTPGSNNYVAPTVPSAPKPANAVNPAAPANNNYSTPTRPSAGGSRYTPPVVSTTHTSSSGGSSGGGGRSYRQSSYNPTASSVPGSIFKPPTSTQVGPTRAAAQLNKPKVQPTRAAEQLNKPKVGPTRAAAQLNKPKVQPSYGSYDPLGYALNKLDAATGIVSKIKNSPAAAGLKEVGQKLGEGASWMYNTYKDNEAAAKQKGFDVKPVRDPLAMAASAVGSVLAKGASNTVAPVYANSPIGKVMASATGTTKGFLDFTALSSADKLLRSPQQAGGLELADVMLSLIPGAGPAAKAAIKVGNKSYDAAQIAAKSDTVARALTNLRSTDKVYDIRNVESLTVAQLESHINAGGQVLRNKGTDELLLKKHSPDGKTTGEVVKIKQITDAPEAPRGPLRDTKQTTPATPAASATPAAPKTSTAKDFREFKPGTFTGTIDDIKARATRLYPDILKDEYDVPIKSADGKKQYTDTYRLEIDGQKHRIDAKDYTGHDLRAIGKNEVKARSGASPNTKAGKNSAGGPKLAEELAAEYKASGKGARAYRNALNKQIALYENSAKSRADALVELKKTNPNATMKDVKVTLKGISKKDADAAYAKFLSDVTPQGPPAPTGKLSKAVNDVVKKAKSFYLNNTNDATFTMADNSTQRILAKDMTPEDIVLLKQIKEGKSAEKAAASKGTAKTPYETARVAARKVKEGELNRKMTDEERKAFNKEYDKTHGGDPDKPVKGKAADAPADTTPTAEQYLNGETVAPAPEVAAPATKKGKGKNAAAQTSPATEAKIPDGNDLNKVTETAPFPSSTADIGPDWQVQRVKKGKGWRLIDPDGNKQVFMKDKIDADTDAYLDKLWKERNKKPETVDTAKAYLDGEDVSKAVTPASVDATPPAPAAPKKGKGKGKKAGAAATPPAAAPVETAAPAPKAPAAPKPKKSEAEIAAYKEASEDYAKKQRAIHEKATGEKLKGDAKTVFNQKAYADFAKANKGKTFAAPATSGVNTGLGVEKKVDDVAAQIAKATATPDEVLKVADDAAALRTASAGTNPAIGNMDGRLSQTSADLGKTATRSSPTLTLASAAISPASANMADELYQPSLDFGATDDILQPSLFGDAGGVNPEFANTTSHLVPPPAVADDAMSAAVNAPAPLPQGGNVEVGGGKQSFPKQWQGMTTPQKVKFVGKVLGGGAIATGITAALLSGRSASSEEAVPQQNHSLSDIYGGLYGGQQPPSQPPIGGGGGYVPPSGGGGYVPPSGGGGWGAGSFQDYMQQNGFPPEMGANPQDGYGTDPATGGEVVRWYMLDEEGNLSEAYDGVLIADPETGEQILAYYDENGQLQEAPEGALVDGKAGLQRMGIPPLEQIIPPLQQVIEENGGFTVDNLMAAYQPYLEDAYDRIDAEMKTNIKILREQLAARGMYNSDIALTLEMELRQNAISEKNSVYNEMYMQAQDKAMEYATHQEELSLEQGRLNETIRSNQAGEDLDIQKFQQAVREFEIETGIRWADLDLDTRSQLYKEWNDSRQYNLDVAKAGASGSAGGAKPATGNTLMTIKAELQNLIETKGASMQQIAAKIKSYVDLGVITPEQASAIVQVLDREMGL